MLEPLNNREFAALRAPNDDDAPVFAAPWEASAFAVVLALYRNGHFEWREWVELLSREIAGMAPDVTGAGYYERWTRALEKLVGQLGLLAPETIAARSAAWRRAYLATPHGREVRLGNAGS